LRNALACSDKINSANLRAIRSTKRRRVSLEVPFADLRRTPQGALYLGESRKVQKLNPGQFPSLPISAQCKFPLDHGSLFTGESWLHQSRPQPRLIKLGQSLTSGALKLTIIS
jgi:hypothetical protein